MSTKPTEGTLVDEIMEYLETVELFRSLGQEPSWRPETVREAPAPPELPPGAFVSHRAH
jgi:hypothetical protein